MIPNAYDNFDWYDNVYLEWFICNHTRIYYEERDFFDAVGYGTWSEVSTFNFKCQMTLFANDKIRTCHFLPMEPGAAKANFVNTNPVDAGASGGKLENTPEEEN